MKHSTKKRIEGLNENIVFLGLVILVFSYGVLSFIKTEKLSSASENRSLATFKHLTAKTFVDGTFQGTFEDALSDQFPLSEKIRVGYGRIMASFPTFGIDRVACANRYLALSNSIDSKRATYDCGDYIVVLPQGLNDRIYENIKKYNKMNKLNDVYYYYITSYKTYDFEQNKSLVDYAAVLSENLSGKYHLSSLKMDGYEDHKKLFTKTDHHWGYTGSYQGFVDIVDMFGIKNPSKPTGTFSSEEYAFGSHARALKNYNYLEKFTIYTFDIPDHNTTINGVAEKSYNHIAEFMNHDYEYRKDMNFYAFVYGNDYGEIIFDYHQPEKPNLLILSNSYSNPVNELIAQYFNKTYVVDLRHYEKSLKSKFKYSEYIKKHNIQKTLVIADSGFLLSRELNQGLEL